MAVTASRKPPTGEGLTFEKVWAMFQEVAEQQKEGARQFQETREQFRETDKKFQEVAEQQKETSRQFKETDKKFQEVSEQHRETERLFKENAEQQKETSRQFKETDRKFQEVSEQHRETERLFKENAEQQKETARQFKETDRIVGKLSNRFGELVEHLVAPNIKEKFNEMGFCFTKTGMGVDISDPKNLEDAIEVDILLENGDIVMAVEVKSKPNDKDLNDHIRRLEILRRHADKNRDKRRYQGAIAGAVMSESVRRYILKKGFYVIEQSGDTVRINVPAGFKAREW
jgi:hypothetical protein